VAESIARLRGADHVSWQSPNFQRRLRTKPPVYHHYVPEQQFRQVETLVNYARSK
jgi:hypothetical protein